jgi:heme exporter protein B
MNTIQEIWFLFRKELTLEFRQKYAISGILLYVFSTIFVVYTSTFDADPKQWNILFWIIVLFASVNTATKSFVQESGSSQLYYYSLVNPVAIIISKMLYNTLLLLVLNFLA